MKLIGFDMGSASLKWVVLDEKGQTLLSRQVPHPGDLCGALREAVSQLEDNEYKVALCGVNARRFALPEGLLVEEAQAAERVRQVLYPQARSIIHAGVQGTFYAARERLWRNGNCAAGTGAFFEEQAGRLGVGVEEIARLQQQAQSVPFIAGRCSVFSKTDTIHLMQEGLPTADILLGLAHAMVRNFRAQVLRNRKVEAPVLLSGGVMRFAGVVQAMRQQLEVELIVPEHPEMLCATGCALLASQILTREQLLDLFSQTLPTESDSPFEPLCKYADSSDSTRYEAQENLSAEGYYLGIDIGSASIDLVLLTDRREVAYTRYVRNMGQPLQTVRTELERIYQSFPRERIRGIAVTGSGREYVAKEIGASLTVNEITAQSEGAAWGNPEAETLFEIGGQDSKFMSLRHGQLEAFEMNKVCAAGTGTFLEEQVRRLGLDMERFISLAMSGEHPVPLGNRCTVFIESSVTRALAEGKPLEDVCAGLVYAVASNYLERVVGTHPLGASIAVQGGIAFNRAVLCAFRALTGRPVRVSPFFHVTGALGAAALGMSQRALRFDGEQNRIHNQQLLARSEQSYLGDYTPPRGNHKGVIGIPRVVFLHKMFPLFRVMLSRLGYEVLLSPLTDNDIIRRAQEHATAETCYPIKLIYGHISWLLDQGVDGILLPRLYTVRHEGSVARRDYACMFMQASPLLMRQAFRFEERGVRLLMPELSIAFGKRFMLKSLISLGRSLGASLPRIIPAAVAGFRELVRHTARLEAFGDEQLQTDEPVFVLVSRVYNIIDPALNMQIESHLHRLGCRVIHLEHLHASRMDVDRPYMNLYWPFGQHQLTGLKLIRDTPNLYPIYITNHGCGPDTAIQHFFQHEYHGKPYLQLEVDEHTSSVGVITRVEAFLHSLRSQQSEEAILLPNYGVYTDLIASRLPSDQRIIRVPVLQRHVPFTYALNKEYHTLLVMLEELLLAVEADVREHPRCRYTLFALSDEGSEVFGQYGRLIQQELSRRGHEVRLQEFLMEDILQRDDCEALFRELLLADVQQNASASPDAGYVVGEPLCLCNDYIFCRNFPGEQPLRMPLSEALLFHLIDRDRQGHNRHLLNTLRALHAQFQQSHPDLFSPLPTLTAAASGKLNFLIGNFARYRFAKTLTLSQSPTTDTTPAPRIHLLNSAEENTAAILKSLLDPLPIVPHDTDHTHL